MRLLPHPVLSVFLVLVWALLFNSASAGVWLTGAVVGVAVPLFTAPFWPDQPRFRRPAVLLRLVPVVLWDIAVANLSVAWIVLTRPSSRIRPAFLTIPLALRDPYGKVLLASIITLTPGTVSVMFSEDRKTLYVHALDCDDEAAAVEEIRERYERPLRELLEC